MLSQSWYGVDVDCPTCKKSCVLQFVCFSGDGELKFQFYCFGCKELVTYKVFASALAYRAMTQDIEKHLATAKAPSKALVVPVAPQVRINTSDAEFLKSLGIKEDFK